MSEPAGRAQAIIALMAEVRDHEETAPDGSVTVDEAAGQLADLAARIGTERRRVVLTERGEVRALMVSVADWEDVRDALDLALNEIDRLTGRDGSVPHEDMAADLWGEGGRS